MAWFTSDFNRFFKELAANNNKDWFDGQRKRYETSVKKPFEGFVAEIIARVSKVGPKLDLSPKDAIFRIHRDVRFSKDKTPYKLHCSAIVSPGGRKDHSTPGMYLELGPEKVAIYGGRYLPEKEELQAIREHIMAHAKQFRALCAQKDFVRLFGTLQGERHKLLPPPFKAAAEAEPLLYLKQYYYMASQPAKLVANDSLADVVMQHYAAMAPMNKFLGGAAL
jgi:uncharacterized protein (TIGR02453 family)